MRCKHLSYYHTEHFLHRMNNMGKQILPVATSSLTFTHIHTMSQTSFFTHDRHIFLACEKVISGSFIKPHTSQGTCCIILWRF